jgi:predicted TIM-barrel fold metal-dependent hydrolase
MRGSILPAFEKFPKEGAIVGRLLAGYADLEIGLMHAVAMALDDFDKALKDMFGVRGESRRINCGEALGRDAYKALGLESDFLAAVNDMRYCLKARNMYAHCTWYDDHSGQLAFVNLEELAKEKLKVNNLHSLQIHHVDEAQLKQLELYFAHTDAMLAYVNYEGRFKNGKININVLPKPAAMVQPPLYL